MAAEKVSVSDPKVQWLRERPYLCVSPYTKYDFRIHHHGFNVSACCNLDVDLAKNKGTTDLVDEVAAAMDRREKHPACWRCYEEEERGHISERIRGLLLRDFDELESYDLQGFAPKEGEIGVKFSNLCNLGCRSCQTSDSTTFEKITKLRLWNPGMSVDLSEMPEYWNLLLETIEKKSQKIEDLIIHPIGGETFIQPGFHKLLDWLIEKDLAKRSRLRITTSLATNISTELENKFIEFKRVELMGSVDSVGENYQHVRWPAKFEKVDQNLNILTRLYRTYPEKFPITAITPIFSLNNVFYLKEILDYWNDWAEETKVPIYLHTMHLYRPEFLAVDILPNAYRGKLLEILSSCVNHPFFVTNNQMLSTVNEYVISTIEILKKDTGNDRVFEDYLKFSADYDKRTRSDSFVGNKKLFELLTPEHVKIYQEFYKTANISIPIYYKINDQLAI